MSVNEQHKLRERHQDSGNSVVKNSRTRRRNSPATSSEWEDVLASADRYY
jgi:hypothetical protein